MLRNFIKKIWLRKIMKEILKILQSTYDFDSSLNSFELNVQHFITSLYSIYLANLNDNLN